ncbi:hypothetical protein [Clostridium estertheticum]|uniref:hypothetical protein n=1 Tax=Clostridium estertheticum TaxID=238834 RepID=UPI001CF24C90|nr:hypothetical protein [Clostridium estertheticum]MCB2357300.1 hypothetical protein [Clostridium estertheticum]WAG40397.1 hypothetical protein LL065_19330 [Clostridium estertheticum]
MFKWLTLFNFFCNLLEAEAYQVKNYKSKVLFIKIEDNEFRYEKVVVEADSDFLIFEVENNEAILLNKENIKVLALSTLI